MNSHFERLVERLNLITDEHSATQILTDFTAVAGFDYYLFQVEHASTTKVLSNLPPDWHSLYRDKGYRYIDPAMQRLRQRSEAFAWANVIDPRSWRHRRFFEDAARFGIRSGISIPINVGFGNVAMLTLASGQIGHSQCKIIDKAVAAAAVGQLYARLSTLALLKTPRPIDLTTNELICLRWSAEGKSMRAIALLEGKSYSTICFHLRNAKQALGVTSLSQATALATQLRLI